MTKTHRWLALVLALLLAFGAIAPSSALAYRGGNQVNPDGEPIEPPMEYGDPDPGSGGSPMQITYVAAWKQILLASLRIWLGLPTESVRLTRASSAMRSLPDYRQRVK